MITPCLDPDFVPAAVWNRNFREKVAADSKAEDFEIALTRPDGVTFRHSARILEPTESNAALNQKYVERLLKFLLWAKGGSRVLISGNTDLTRFLASEYSENGTRKFDWKTLGENVFGEAISVTSVNESDLPEENLATTSQGKNLDGCRIGFDLGGSDRKYAAVIDGEVVFSEEVAWDPYFQSDPDYHYKGIVDSLAKAAAYLPKVDAIGGSAAGIYINNEVRLASLFRGVTDPAVFQKRVQPMFTDIVAEHYPGVPFEIANDGDVTALAGAMSLNTNGVLGIAMGTAEAVGYVNTSGQVTPQLNELAFAPVDYRENGPADEWSGDSGCGVQFFSQQGVARLTDKAGFKFGDMPFPEQLIEVQNAMNDGHEGARNIYDTLGVCFGYSIAHYAKFYDINTLIIMGRVTSGSGGDLLMDRAKEVLTAEYPELAEKITFTIPDEKMKRHGQAIAAASLPTLA
ncbi:ROK family protein [bacterium]|nr:ROK family protein [bacterium]MDC0275893.1 ROK family protein [Verrucomicrobiales bacterium]